MLGPGVRLHCMKPYTDGKQSEATVMRIVSVTIWTQQRLDRPFLSMSWLEPNPMRFWTPGHGGRWPREIGSE